ncbi:MAG TPA: 1-acyl-sn-glycerol-3-phosphate acyltransferase [Candidatus Brocadiia bacterium]|nr:1-acyl-sn-glycerol-3-phosphate acyltransferase [Candidatus Brocadiia bacterium]
MNERGDGSKETRGPGRPSEWAVGFLNRILGPLLTILFRPTLSGLENLPADRPFLLVANHSGGLGLAELSCFAALYAAKYGTGRPLAGFALPIGFRVWPLSAIHRALGSVPSTYEAAEDALGRGVPLLVFPGGDHETLRPIWQANRVDFAGRCGFLRIAHKANAPIVPMGIRGGHFTAPILLRSKALAWALAFPRLAGVKRWGISLFGLIVSGVILTAPFAWVIRVILVWLWLGSPFVYLPIIPWRIRFIIGSPLPPDSLFSPDDHDMGKALDIVEQEVQKLVNLA